MAEDRTKLNDLSGKNKPKVSELERYYKDWADKCNIQEREKA